MLNEDYEIVLQQIEEQVSRLAALKARLELFREQIKTLRVGVSRKSYCTHIYVYLLSLAIQRQCGH
jgi:cell division protein FtsB